MSSAHDGFVVRADGLTTVFVNTDQPPVRVEYRGSFVERGNQDDHGVWHYSLFYIEEVYFPHPQTDQAHISLLRTRCIKRLSELDSSVSPLIVLYHAQQTAKMFT